MILTRKDTIVCDGYDIAVSGVPNASFGKPKEFIRQVSATPAETRRIPHIAPYVPAQPDMQR